MIWGDRKWAAQLFAGLKKPMRKDPERGLLKATIDKSKTPKLRLKAEMPEDLATLSALSANAAGLVKAVRYARRAGRITFQLSRYRHEGRGDPDLLGPHGERVSAILEVRGVLRAQTQGTAQAEAYEILALEFDPNDPNNPDDPGGTLRVICADPVTFALQVEALEVFLTDMSEPWAAKFDPAPPAAPEDDPETDAPQEEDAP